jgi:hypothetical protein
MLALWITFIILNIVDAYSTWLVIQQYGIKAELNPIIYHVMETYGVNALFAWKTFWIGIIFLCHQFITTKVLIILNIVFLLVVIGNLWHLPK